MSTVRYCWVRAGVITPPPPGTVWAQGREQLRNPFARPYAVGTAPAPDSDAALAELGVYRIAVTERGDPPGLDYLPTTAAPSVDDEGHVVRVIEGWRAMDAVELTAALAAARAAKLAELAAEAERRFAVINSGITSIDAYLLFEAVVSVIKPEARSAIPALLTQIKAVADAGRAARTVIQGLATLAALAAYDVTTDPAWP